MERPLEVRLVGPDAWESWRAIRLRSLEDSPDAFGSTLAHERGFGPADWQQRLADPAVLGFDEDHPVTMGGGWRQQPGQLRVVAMWTEPAFRGRGLSRRVLDLLVATAREEGRAVTLDVNLGNTVARRFYERFGFVGTGVTRPLREGSRHVVEEMILPDPDAG